MVVIQESGMLFGEYAEESVYQIEKDPLYQRLNRHGIRCCEFLLKRGSRLYFVEAKTTCPGQRETQNPEEKTEEEREEDYPRYIHDIVTKMRHSLSLYASALLARQENSAIPAPLRSPDLSGKDIRLVLVVKNAEEAWLIPLQDKLRKELKQELRIWNVNDIFVINEDRARRKGFLLPPNHNPQKN